MITKEQKDILERMRATLEAKRVSTRDPIWKDVLRLTEPTFTNWDDSSPDDHQLELGKDIYNGAATQASLLMAKGLAGYACGSSIDWFALGFEDARQVKRYGDPDVMARKLQDRERVMYSKFRSSSFYETIKSAFKLGADIGTVILLQEWDDNTSNISYHLIHPKDAVIMQDWHGEVDTLIYQVWLTKSDMIDAFGEERLPKSVTECEDETELHKVYRYVGRNRRLKLDVPGSGGFVSVYWSDEASQTDPVSLSESRMDRKCFACWRYDKSIDGNVWGSGSPGITALSDNKSLQVFSRSIQTGAINTAYPAWKKTLGLTINTMPGQATPLMPGQDFAPVQIAGDYSIAFQEKQEVITSIRSAYNVDFFLALLSSQSRQKTATEAEGLQNEQSALLGAEFDRMSYELLEPVIEYAYQELLRHGCFEADPILDDEDRSGVRLHIDFVSPMATMQRKYHELVPSERWIAAMANMAQVDQTILDFVDFSGYARLSATIGRVNRQVIVDDEKVRELRQKRAEVQSQQAVLAQRAEDQKSQAQAYLASTKAPEEGSPAAMATEQKRRAV